MTVVELLDLEHIEARNRKKNVCAYARVSTLSDLQETSFDLQVETYTKMIMKRTDWNFVGVYSDEGKSGTSTKHRDQFNLMIDLATAGGIDLIITKSVSRFTRNTIDCLSIIQKLRRYNVEVWFEKENISSLDPKIEFVITVMAGMAEEESRNISDNVKWGIKKRFKDGIVPMVTSKVLGYKRDKDKNIVVEELEAKIVRRIFKMYAGAYSIRGIASELNKEGLKTKFYHKDYGRSTVVNIINNEKYTGNALLQKSKRKKVGVRTGEKNQQTHPKYYVENSHPAIISQKLWDNVHDKKNKRILKYNHTLDIKIRKKVAQHRSIYNQFIKCAKCGKNYHFKTNNKGQPWESKILICSSNRERKTCDNDSLFAKTFDKVMITHINYIIKNKYEFINKVHEVLMTHPEIRLLNSELAETEDKLNEIDVKLKELTSSSSEFNRLVADELIGQQESLQVNLMKHRNKLLTTHNINAKIKQFKMIFREFKSPITKLDEFPFKDLFYKAIVHNRNYIEILLNPFETTNEDSIFAFPEIITQYTIRKTTHEIESKIICL